MLNLTQIQHHDRHGNSEANGFFQLCVHFAEITFPFGETELSLHFDPLALVKNRLLSVTALVLLGSAKRRAAETDPMQLAIAEILTVSIDLICQHTLRIMSLPLTVTLYCFDQPCSFIVSVKRPAFQSCPSVGYTDIQFCVKLYRFPRLASHDWPDERLTDVDDTVRHRMRMVVIHVLLLLIDLLKYCEPGLPS